MKVNKRFAARAAAVAATTVLGVAVSTASAHANTYIGGSIKTAHCWGELYSDSSTSSPNNWAYGAVTDSSGPFVNTNCEVEVVQRKIVGSQVYYNYGPWSQLWTPDMYHNDGVHEIQVCIWETNTNATACSRFQS